jgi:hypothetical protein
MRKQAIDLIGQRFGKLTVIARIVHAEAKNHTQWLCRCDCGKEITTWGPQLRGSKNRKGQTQCKQCSSPENGRRTQTPDTLLKYLLGRYRDRAKKKGFAFTLILDDIAKLVRSNCYYCGDPPFAIFTKHTQRIPYTGIDRIDNAQGYVLDNVVPCCKFCNQAKMDRTQEDFLVWLKRAYDHNHGEHNT